VKTSNSNAIEIHALEKLPMSIELRMSMLVHEDTQWNAENQGQPGMDATGTAQLQASLISAQSSVSGCFDDDR
jgi:hypothetical protein